MNSKPSYNFTFDVIRVLALSGVMMIHTANVVYARLDFFGGINWWIAIILDSISRISVPLFIMLSGYLLLSRNESFTHTLKRLGFRLLLPLFFWAIIYTLWNGENFSLIGLSTSFWPIVLSGKIFHLYFLVILAGLYAISPFLRSYIVTASLKKQAFITGSLLFFSILYTAVEYFFHLCSRENILSMWIPYTGVFLAGYYFVKKKHPISPFVWLTYGLGLVATVLFNYVHYTTLSQGVNLFFPPGCISHYSDYFLSLNVLIMSLSAYLLLIQTPFATYINKILQQIIKNIASKSFGMYLCHLLIIYVIDEKFHTFDYIHPLWLAIGIKWGVIFLLSYGLTSVGMRLPLLKYVFGGK